jgi:hypothetical protein
MEAFLGIIVIVFAVLQIILFFKLCGMTNDVRQIKNTYLSNHNEQFNDAHEVYANNDIVVNLETGKRMRLGEQLITGKYKCYTQDDQYIGDFDKSEFMELDKFLKYNTHTL